MRVSAADASPLTGAHPMTVLAAVPTVFLRSNAGVSVTMVSKMTISSSLKGAVTTAADVLTSTMTFGGTPPATTRAADLLN